MMSTCSNWRPGKSTAASGGGRAARWQPRKRRSRGRIARCFTFPPSLRAPLEPPGRGEELAHALDRNRLAGVALLAGHGGRLEERVVDRLLDRLDGGEEEGAHGVVRQLLDGEGRLLGVVGDEV